MAESPLWPRRLTPPRFSEDPEAAVLPPSSPQATDTIATTPAAKAKGPRAASTKTEPGQLLYLFVHGLGGMIISGAINFLIAWAMYPKNDDKVVTLWGFPNTLAGDTGVTIIVQCVITWLVELIVVRADIRHGRVTPMAVGKPSNSRFKRWFFFRDGGGPRLSATGLLTAHAPRVFFFVLATFCLVFPISMPVLSATGSGWGQDRRIAPTNAWKFKLVLGALVGLVVTPLMTYFWLLEAGWAQQEDGQRGRQQVDPPVPDARADTPVTDEGEKTETAV